MHIDNSPQTPQENPSEPINPSLNGFAAFNLDASIIKSLDKMQFKTPSPIQAATIPLILQGRDLIALAQTGTGKTAACSIPICEQIDISHKYVQALIIVPTRELALQYATETQKIGDYKGVKAFAIFGGEDASLQQSKLKHGVHVLIATPGRLIDFIYSRQIDLTNVKTLILDEADEMLGMGFADDLEFIIQCLVHSHQTLLFSATMPAKISILAKNYMQNPVEVNLIQEHTNPHLLEHFFVFCSPHEKEDKLLQLIREEKPAQAIIFCHSRFQVEKVCAQLKRKIDGVDFLHAGLAQNIRSIVTSKFRSGKIKYLVATDVVSRGLDFSNVSHVFIYQLSDDSQVYVHRSGRTGRYGKEGVVISLVTHRDLPLMESIKRHLNKELSWIGPPPNTPHLDPLNMLNPNEPTLLNHEYEFNFNYGGSGLYRLSCGKICAAVRAAHNCSR